MRVLLAVFLTSSCLAIAAAADFKNRPPTLRVGSQEYVALREWAESKQLSFAKKDEEVRLSSRTLKLTFKTNSQRAEFDGIDVFLSFPVAFERGAVWVSKKDLERTIDPIVFPPRNKPKPAVRIVAISAGHGGKDSGYQMGDQQEKKLTLLLSQELQKLAIAAGLKVVPIRDSDLYLDRAERPKLAKKGKADVYLELHYNCGGVGNYESRGVEVYCLTPPGAESTNGGSDQYPSPLPGTRHDGQSVLLAYQVQKSLVQGAGLADRGVRRARFEVLREAQMPAILIEAGFMSQADEMRKIRDPAFRRQTAQAILDGLLAYKRLLER